MEIEEVSENVLQVHLNGKYIFLPLKMMQITWDSYILKLKFIWMFYMS